MDHAQARHLVREGKTPGRPSAEVGRNFPAAKLELEGTSRLEPVLDKLEGHPGEIVERQHRPVQSDGAFAQLTVVPLQPGPRGRKIFANFQGLSSGC